ncbi:glycosyltransferase family 4 protein [Clostridium hydrogenum]|uniref:glycosyltransferase family 4 protein n=1 Tax=Clostridium hydrogenum TaxID=2855764 RepID=UPI001F230EC4|nr:glycosyltransferase family 4 protein [Clostridium hydrogenum]
MKITFVTNARAPYRMKQLEKISEVDTFDVTVCYTDKNLQGRAWKVDEAKKIKEKQLNGVLLSKKYGYLNFGLIKLIKEADYIILGGYEQPTYIVLSIICRIIKKPYLLFFDGISTNRISMEENKLKKLLKGLVINNSKAIWGNGTVSREYFAKNFNYNRSKIVNQCLTVDIESIKKIIKDKNTIRSELRKKYNIQMNKKVIMYSGRLVEVKNLKIVIDAISQVKEEIVFFIAGGGLLEQEIINYSQQKNVHTIITGFIKDQNELFKNYSVGDVFILPSIYEPWGLVVNEAMATGLPVLVSEICGCSMDLVKEGENGYTFSPYNLDDLIEKINRILGSNTEEMGKNSQKIISEWNFNRSRDNFIEAIELAKYSK